jgi:hypothetical protein
VNAEELVCVLKSQRTCELSTSDGIEYGKSNDLLSFRKYSNARQAPMILLAPKVSIGGRDSGGALKMKHLFAVETNLDQVTTCDKE